MYPGLDRIRRERLIAGVIATATPIIADLQLPEKLGAGEYAAIRERLNDLPAETHRAVVAYVAGWPSPLADPAPPSAHEEEAGAIALAVAVLA